MRIPRISRARFELVSVLFILLVGCGTPPSSTNLNFLTVKVSSSTVSVGSAVTLQAVAHLSNGSTQDVTSGTQWTLSNPSLATMGNGVLTSKAPGTLTVQAAYVLAVAAGQAASTAASTPQTLSSSAQVTITAAGTSTTAPAITWNTPAPIQYGTALSSALLDATANVPGSFTYTPAAGTVLKVGTQKLTAVFTPTDTKAYSAATASVQLTVSPASPLITWAPPSAIQQGTALSAAQLNATANVPGAFSYSPAVGTVPPVGIQALTATFTPSDATDYLPATAHNTLIVDAPGASTPTISWNAPASISYGTALSSAQLNATASVPGTFTYTPAAGTLLKVGTQTLSAIFTPTNTSAYSPARATVQLTVTKASPVITWPQPSPLKRGTALSATQLNATANVPGVFSYSPAAGTIPPVGIEALTVTFTPSDATDYMAATAHNTLIVDAPGMTTPTIRWAAPAPISYGTALSSAQLNATASVAGTFTYTPAAGTVLKAGTQTLSAIFTPTNKTAYSPATAIVLLTVTKINPVITWAPLAAITQGTALSAAQLDATANLPGTFSYNPGVGNVPATGTLQLTATFTPTDSTDYASATAHNTLTVNASKTGNTSISWTTPAAISYGTALSSTQLNARASVAGTFAYTPAAGTVLKAGVQTLTVVFTPTDTTTYSAATATVQLTVNQITPVIAWAPLAAIAQGTATQFSPARRNSEHPRHVCLQPRSR